MLHLLDANVLITANRLYYPLERVPEFWEWLLHHAAARQVLSDRDHLDAMCFDEEADIELVQRVINNGYAPDLNDQEVEIIGRDPFLIAYALHAPADRCVVTTEVSKPKRVRANRRVPDVCTQMQIPWMDSFGLATALDFSTAWRTRI